MKKASILLLAILTLTAGAFARGDFEIDKIQVNFVNTPNVNFSGNAKPISNPQSWLEVEVTFKSNVPFTDELSVRYYAYLEKKCVTGTVTHINVPKGMGFLSVMYLSPSSQLRLALANNKTTVSKSPPDEVTVQILSKGQVVAEKSMKGTQGEWWTKPEQSPSGFLNKNQTPFAPLYWDRYLEIKPESHQ